MAKKDDESSELPKHEKAKKLGFKKDSKKSKKTKAKSGNPISRYLKGAYSELKKVTWPDRSETTRLTIGVIIYSLAFALFIALVDYIFDIGFERFIV